MAARQAPPGASELHKNNGFMADDISIAYRYSGPSGNPYAPNPYVPNPYVPKERLTGSGLVAFADCEIIPVDGQKTLVISRLNGKQQFFAPSVVDALMTCTRFDTIDGHSRRLCAERRELTGQEAAVESTLGQLDEGGFLLDSGRIRRQLLTREKRPRAPSAIFIITCDRPNALERLLESLLCNAKLGAHEELTLIDDSRSAAKGRANRALVQDFNRRSARDMQYFGAEQQSVLLEHLCGELPEAEQGARFLIDPEPWEGKKTYGRSRTLALLLSVGKRALVLDDDILCQALQPAVREPGMGLTGQRQAAFYRDRETLMASAVSAGIDPLMGHLKYLGQNLGFALSDIGHGEIATDWLQGANAAMLNELRADTPVLITQCGSWGDPGAGSAHWALHLDESSIERLASAPHGMREALENRCSWFGCTRPTLHKMAFMSQMTGIDNSQLLPPYFPAFRGEDLLFASMVEAMYHHGAVLEYGWCVPHLPLDDRGDRGLHEPIAGAAGMALFTRCLLESIDYKDAGNPRRRLIALAGDARRMADRSNGDLLLDYRREQAKAQAQLLHVLAHKARHAEDLPSADWRSYVNRALSEVETSIAEVHLPSKIPGIRTGTSTDEEVLAEFRQLAIGWASALSSWPAIRECAQGRRRAA